MSQPNERIHNSKIEAIIQSESAENDEPSQSEFSPPTPEHEDIQLNYQRHYDEIDNEEKDIKKDEDDEVKNQKFTDCTTHDLAKIIKTQVKEEYDKNTSETNEKYTQNLMKYAMQSQKLSQDTIIAQHDKHMNQMTVQNEMQRKFFSEMMSKVLDNNQNQNNQPRFKAPNPDYSSPRSERQPASTSIFRANNSGQSTSTPIKRPYNLISKDNCLVDKSKFSPYRPSKIHKNALNAETKNILKYHFYESNYRKKPDEMEKPPNKIYNIIEMELASKRLPALTFSQIADQFKKYLKNFREDPDDYWLKQKKYFERDITRNRKAQETSTSGNADGDQRLKIADENTLCIDLDLE